MTSKLYDKWIATELESLQRQAMLRSVPKIDHGADRHIELGGRRLINLASNDYLGLAGRKELKDAAVAAVNLYGCGAAASRLVTGNFALYDELEKSVAEFQGMADAMFFPAGYSANLAIMDAFADRHTVVFSDRLNHASILDGIRLSGAKQVRYRHNDVAHLEALLQKHADNPRKILVTDTIFSMDGDLAPLEDIISLCSRHDVFIVLDEAHAEGIFGTGRGVAEALGLTAKVDLHMGAFSKAFGSLGGYVAGSANAISLLRNRGRSFVFSTALPPAVIGANLAALSFVRENSALGYELLKTAEGLRQFLKSLGFETGDSRSQIIPVVLKENEKALEARDFLIDKGLYCAAIRPPTVPPNTARLRLSMRADLDCNDLEIIREAFKALAWELFN